MKILQLCNKVPFPSKDGGSIAIANLTQGMAQLDNEVHVLAMNTKKHFVSPSDDLNPDKKNIKLFYVYVNTQPRPIRMVSNFLFSGFPYNAQRFISADYTRRLKSLLTEYKYDIIQLEGLYLFPYIRVIRKYSTARISYRAHNIENEIWYRLASDTAFYKRIYLKNLAGRIETLENKMLKSVDMVLPISAIDARKIKAIYPDVNFHVVPSGINTNLVNNNTNFSKDIYFIGSLDWLPNREGILWFLDKVWKRLHHKWPSLQLHIAGRNAPLNFLKNHSYENVIFHGEVESSGEFMQKFGIMIVPLFAGSGMRVKIIEAMAYGKPVISTSIGAEGIEVTHNENILIANSEKEFTEETGKLLENQKTYRLIQKNSLEYVHNYFNNVNICKSLLNFYSKQG
jgi:polysaccharide biosynthesis protein PslH